MKILIENLIKQDQLFDTDAADSLGEGNEGEIYKIPEEYLVSSNDKNNNNLVKIYYDDADEDVLTLRQDKGMLLVDKYRDFVRSLEHETGWSASQFAFPEHTAVDAENKKYAGFSMQDMGRYSTLDNFIFNFNKNKIINVETGFEMSDEDAAELCYNITYGVSRLHKINIILGDLNERNILYNIDKKMPSFVDIDSAQVESFSSTAYTPEILDPSINRKRLDGTSDQEGAYEYSVLSDIFAMAVNFYRLLTGSHPTFFRANNKEGGAAKLTKNKIFFLRARHDKYFLKSSGIELLDNSELEKRLDELNKKFPDIYKYFLDIFVNDKRYYLTELLPQSDFRNPNYSDYIKAAQDYDYENDTAVPDVTDLNSSIVKDSGFTYGEFKLAEWLNKINLRHTNGMNDSDAFKFFVNNIGYDYDQLFNEILNI